MQLWRARLGFLIPSTDAMQEVAYYRMVPEGISVHFTRLTLKEVSVKALMEMAEEIGKATALISMTRVDAIGYGCTSGTVAIGDQEIVKRVRKVNSNAEVSTMATAVVNALRVMKLRKIAMATPYIDEINEKEVEFFENFGFTIVTTKGLGIKDDYEISQVSTTAIYRLARSVNASDAEGLFISCGDLRSHEVVEVLEKDIGKPIITSNQAMIWDMLRKCKIRDRIQGYGRLLYEF